MQLQFNEPLAGKVEIEVSDVSGKVVMKKVVDGRDAITLPIAIGTTSKLAPGTYAVKVMNNGVEFVQKMIVR